jgi:histone H1/5
MAETTSEIVSADKAVTSPKKGKATKVKKPRSVPSHPKTSDMVNAAITNLKERGGSSLQAIKKYVAATYKVDVEKLSPFIKKYLKSAVTSGALVQTKGKGASGSFKLSGNSGKGEKKAEGKKAASPKKAAKTTKASPAKKSKPSAASKTAKPKKKSAAAKPAAKKASPAGKKKATPTASKPKKSPKKEKKPKVQKKPKSPKPKKASAGKKAAAKK